MLKSKLIAPLLISIFAFSVVMSVNSESLFQAQGTSGTFTEENPPTYLLTNPDQTYFWEGDTISYAGWTIDVYLVDESFITLTNVDFAEFITFSPVEGTSLSPSDTSVEITFMNPVGGDLYDSVPITVEAFDPCMIDPLDPACYTPMFTVSIWEYPDKLTYFVGETLDLTGIFIDVTDYNSINHYSLGYNDSRISFRSVTTNLPIAHDDVLTMDDANLEIVYVDDYYLDAAEATYPLTLTLYPETPYQFDFVNDVYTVLETNLSATRTLETFGLTDDQWLIKSYHDEDATITMRSGNFSEGLVFEETMNQSAFDVSLLSQHLWGIEGMAGNDGLLNTYVTNPIIQAVYIKAYAPSGGGEVGLAVNDNLITASTDTTLAMSEFDNSDWIIFPLYPTRAMDLSVGHLELMFSSSGGGPVYLQELRIASTNDDGTGEFTELTDVMNLAHAMESLDSCTDQTSFIDVEQFNYDSFDSNPTYSNLIENLMLRDRSITGGDANELIVTMASKWEMMESRSQNEFAPPNERRGFALAIENSLPTIGWSFFTLLSLAFYFKFKLVV
jgi:hypothetical protein